MSVGEEGYNGVGVVVREDATWGGCVFVMPERQPEQGVGWCIRSLGEICFSYKMGSRVSQGASNFLLTASLFPSPPSPLSVCSALPPSHTQLQQHCLVSRPSPSGQGPAGVRAQRRGDGSSGSTAPARGGGFNGTGWSAAGVASGQAAGVREGVLPVWQVGKQQVRAAWLSTPCLAWAMHTFPLLHCSTVPPPPRLSNETASPSSSAPTCCRPNLWLSSSPRHPAPAPPSCRWRRPCWPATPTALCVSSACAPTSRR